MSKFKKSLSILIILILSLSLFAGCKNGNTKQASNDNKNQTANKNAKVPKMETAIMDQLKPLPEIKKGTKIGALVISLTNPFWVGMKESYEKAAKELGVTIDVMAAPTEGDTKAQLETLESMIAKDYAAIIVSPIEPNNLIPGIKKAKEKGIKIINLGPAVNQEALNAANVKLDGKITVNFEDQGKLAAEYIVKKIGAEGGKVAIIQGIPGAGQSEGRTNGAKKVFQSNKNIKLVSVQPANWDRNTAYNITTNLIQSNPDLKGIYCCNDIMALAAADALKAAGKRDGKIIVGVDLIKEAREGIKDKKIDGTIGYSSEVYAKGAVLLSLKAASGENIEKPVYSPLVMVNTENVSEFNDWK